MEGPQPIDRESVELIMVEAWRDLPGTPLLHHRACHFASAGPGGSGRAEGLAEALTWVGRFLVTYPEERTALVYWLTAKAGKGEASITEICALKGWSRDAFDDRRKRASTRIAAGLSELRSAAAPPR